MYILILYHEDIVRVQVTYVSDKKSEHSFFDKGSIDVKRALTFEKCPLVAYDFDIFTFRSANRGHFSNVSALFALSKKLSSDFLKIVYL